MNESKQEFDYLLVGGGLQSGLIALALRDRKPDASIAIIEQGARLAGNHTWSYHETDVPSEAVNWLTPLVEHEWSVYKVEVGGMEKQIEIGYRSISSSHFARVVEEACNDTGHGGLGRVFLNTRVEHCNQRTARLSDGRTLSARCVIDCRGPSKDSIDRGECFPGGYQKFWGFELSLPEDWVCSKPIVMDDRVDQQDGFRFFYTLPFEPRRVMIEDTRFSNTSQLERADCFLQVDRYLRLMTDGRVGIERCRILREESGVLPMPYQGHFPETDCGAIVGGYRGGWFHAATGYSFPMAVRFAQCVATSSIDELPEALAKLAERDRLRSKFSRLLNRLLFRLVRPESRYQIFKRFYRVLSVDRVARFYSHRFTLGDAAKIVIGIPPTGLRPIRFARSFFGRRGSLNRFRLQKFHRVNDAVKAPSTNESAPSEEVIS